ncbi:hypothetical protein LTR08_001840 [Meristemomyces frigidus]|nr:hypothetical protein LTR08_001840 [Meristemomyces frigidus]
MAREVIHASPKGLARTFPASTDMGFNTTEDEPPLPNAPGQFEEQWLINDFAQHAQALEEWHRATWRTCSKNDTPHRHMSDKDARVSVPGEDFPVKTPLCLTYTADRNMAWWAEHVEDIEIKDYEGALAKYKQTIVEAEQFYNMLSSLFVRSTQATLTVYDHQALCSAHMQKTLVLHNLKEARKAAAERGNECKQHMDAVDFCRPEQLEARWDNLYKSHTPTFAQQSGPVMPTPSIPIGNTPRPQSQAPVKQNLRTMRQGGTRTDNNAVAAPIGRQPHGHAPIRQKPDALRPTGTHEPPPDMVAPAGRRSQVPGVTVLKKVDSATEGTEPSPEYHDPMSGPSDDAVADSRFARVRVQDSVSGANIQSGITAELNSMSSNSYISSQLPRTPRATTPLSMLANPLSPATPGHWAGTTEESDDDGDESGDYEPLSFDRPRAATGVAYCQPMVEGDDAASKSLMAEFQNK